ncbi:MAG: Snf7 family protein [Rhabdochlamydiaceae bacterium]
MAKFISRWQKPQQDKENFGSKIRGGLRSSEPIKPKIEQASRQLQMQVAKLDLATSKLRERDAAIFSKIISSVQKNENSRANMLANELSELRKMKVMLTQAKLALEQIILRLSTVSELGDLAVTLTPALNVIRGVRPGLASLVPNAEQEIGEISGLLSGILVESEQVRGAEPAFFEASSGDAEKVLAEAEAIVASKMSSKFPAVPEDSQVNVEEEAETA